MIRNLQKISAKLHFIKLLLYFGFTVLCSGTNLASPSTNPSTSVPSTSMPSTSIPSSSMPSSQMPSTGFPSSSLPSSTMPSSQMPTSGFPSSMLPSSLPSSSNPSKKPTPAPSNTIQTQIQYTVSQVVPICTTTIIGVD